ncbi:hypothetical protein CR513_52815, partial [Mucuna pruriens]
MELVLIVRVIIRDDDVININNMLVKRPMVDDGHSKKWTNKNNFWPWEKGDPIVENKNLSIALSHQVSFKLINLSIRANFLDINPVTSK